MGSEADEDDGVSCDEGVANRSSLSCWREDGWWKRGYAGESSLMSLILRYTRDIDNTHSYNGHTEAVATKRGDKE
jgi:hypothetical protein